MAFDPGFPPISHVDASARGAPSSPHQLADAAAACDPVLMAGGPSGLKRPDRLVPANAPIAPRIRWVIRWVEHEILSANDATSSRRPFTEVLQQPLRGEGGEVVAPRFPQQPSHAAAAPGNRTAD